jgi:hypothetical protein
MAKKTFKNQNDNQPQGPKSTGTTWMKITMIASLGLMSVVALVAYSLNSSSQARAGEEVVIYKSPSCGCCGKWVDHMKSNGFTVKVHNQNNMNSIKRQFGIQPKHQSCHTAKVGGYVIEGHVPAVDITRLLMEKPDIKGLAAPGMPMGSPGMEGPRKDNYNVLAIDHNDSTRVYSQH